LGDDPSSHSTFMAVACESGLLPQGVGVCSIPETTPQVPGQARSSNPPFPLTDPCAIPQINSPPSIVLQSTVVCSKDPLTSLGDMLPDASLGFLLVSSGHRNSDNNATMVLHAYHGTGMDLCIKDAAPTAQPTTICLATQARHGFTTSFNRLLHQTSSIGLILFPSRMGSSSSMHGCCRGSPSLGAGTRWGGGCDILDDATSAPNIPALARSSTPSKSPSKEHNNDYKAAKSYITVTHVPG